MKHDNHQTNPNLEGNEPIDISAWRVLIVDDVRDNVTIVETVLQLRGADVATATNGIEGLKAVELFKPNLILLDLSMPYMDGWEMQQHLSQSIETATIPVIALTAHALRGDKERALSAGFTGYITKPFSVATFVNDIFQILQVLR